MGTLEMVSMKELRELLCMGWMTHDGMWFNNVFQNFGAKTASRLNRAAIRSMCAFEVPRLKKVLGIEAVDSYDGLKAFIEGAFDLVGADFMKFSYSFPGNKVMIWEIADGECFAYKGVKRIGAQEDYDCGILTRIEAWLEMLDVDYQMTPEVNGCLMHKGRPCRREFHLNMSY